MFTYRDKNLLEGLALGSAKGVVPPSPLELMEIAEEQFPTRSIHSLELLFRVRPERLDTLCVGHRVSWVDEVLAVVYRYVAKTLRQVCDVVVGSPLVGSDDGT